MAKRKRTSRRTSAKRYVRRASKLGKMGLPFLVGVGAGIGLVPQLAKYAPLSVAAGYLGGIPTLTEFGIGATVGNLVKQYIPQLQFGSTTQVRDIYL